MTKITQILFSDLVANQQAFECVRKIAAAIMLQNKFKLLVMF